MDKTTEKLTDFALSLRYQDLAPTAVHETKKRLIDSFGCAIGAFANEPVRIARKLAVCSSGVPPAQILGSAATTSMEMAAFANSVMVRSLDCNDMYISKGHGHPSDMIPGILAVADAYHRNGEDMLTALVVAYEVFAVLADAFSTSDKGWDHGIYLVMGAAAGAGKLLGLTKTQMGDALAIAITANIATRQTRFGKLSMWKGCAAAASVRAGVFAALLAREGMTGPTEAFEGRHGFWDQVTGPFELRALENTISPLAVERSHLKYFPAEYHAQAPLWLALGLREKVHVDDIEAINIQTYRIAYREICSEPGKWDPQTRESADHSLPYMLAIALRDGALTAASFSEEFIRDPGLRPLMNRIKISESAEFTEQYPAALVSELDITTKGHSRYVERTTHPKGHTLNPMSDADVEAKFNGICRELISLDQCHLIQKALWDVEHVDNVSRVLELTRISGDLQ